MNDVSRRDCLRLSLLGGAAVAIGGCATVANHFAEHHRDPTLPAGDVDKTTRLVHRMSFGPRPGDIKEAKEMGHEAYVTAALKPGDDEDLRLMFLLQRLSVFQMDPWDAM